jgi:hypothetical protein
MLSRPRRRAAAVLGQNPNKDKFLFFFFFPIFQSKFSKDFQIQI